MIFGVTDCESELKIQTFKMDPKCKKLLDWNLVLGNAYSGFFSVADYEFELNIQKLKMSDAIWRVKMQKAKSYAAKGFLRYTFLIFR